MLKQIAPLALAAMIAGSAGASPLADAFHDTIPEFENFLASVDDLDAVLWTGTSFSQKEVWEIVLHSALAAQVPLLEAQAQQALVGLGMSEQEMAALYRIDPSVYDAGEVAMLTFAQRSAVLPTRVNASDINELREHYDQVAVTELAMINAYVNMFDVLYGTGYVEAEADLTFPGLTPQLMPLQQEKIKTAAGWSDRQYFESPLVALDLSLPFIDLDGVMLEEPHSFDLGEVWEMFVVGQTASDCGHCIAHGAYGMHLAYRDRADIIAAYHYDGTGDYTAKEKARLDFVQAAMVQPSAVTEAERTALEATYTDTEIQHLIGVTTYMAMLSTYMQISGTVTDNESADFAAAVLGPEGFDIGRHVGAVVEQRRMHPITLYRLTPDGSGLDRTLLFSAYALRPVMLGTKFTTLPGPVLQFALEVMMLIALLLGWNWVKRRRV